MKNKERIAGELENLVLNVLEGRQRIDGALDKKETEWTVVNKVRDIVEDIILQAKDSLSCASCPHKKLCPIVNDKFFIRGKTIAAGNLLYMDVNLQILNKFDLVCSPMAFLESYYEELGKDTVTGIVIAEYAVQLTNKVKSDDECSNIVSAN